MRSPSESTLKNTREYTSGLLLQYGFHLLRSLGKCPTQTARCCEQHVAAHPPEKSDVFQFDRFWINRIHGGRNGVDGSYALFPRGLVSRFLRTPPMTSAITGTPPSLYKRHRRTTRKTHPLPLSILRTSLEAPGITHAMSHTAIVQKLVDYLESNPGIHAQFEKSLKEALSHDLEEFHNYGIKNLQDYFNYMDTYVNWIPTENCTGRNVVEHICVFYFVLQLSPIKENQEPIYPSVTPPYAWLSQWLIDYAQAMGAWMNTPNSITKESIDSFYTAKGYRMQDYPVPKGGWKTFNEFFARHIDPAERPIAPDTSDEVVIVNPADCAFDGVWNISPDTVQVTFSDECAKEDMICAKGIPWTISQLLADTRYCTRFAGGTFTHSFLAPSDYHRQHAPVSGTVIEAKVIPGLCYLEVVYEPSKSPSGHGHLAMVRTMHLPTLTPDGSIRPPNSPGYQFLQARGLILIDNPDLGLVAVLPIGMAQVSSVVLSVKPGDVLKKGDEISYFQFGGSDVVMVFQKAAGVKFNQEIGKHYKFGTAVATAPKKATGPKTT